MRRYLLPSHISKKALAYIVFCFFVIVFVFVSLAEYYMRSFIVHVGCVALAYFCLFVIVFVFVSLAEYHMRS